MYTPSQFRAESDRALLDFVRAHPFGILLSGGEANIETTHTPFLLSEDGSVLSGHIARANPHWKNWNAQGETPAKCLFTGPHAYISPSFYSSEFNVPTWNYTAVHLSGKLHIETDPERCLKFINQLTETFEPGEGAWKFDPEDPRYLKLLDAIVVFHIAIDSAEGTFKLNQNKAHEDQLSVIENLRKSEQPSDHQVAALMEANLTNAKPTL